MIGLEQKGAHDPDRFTGSAYASSQVLGLIGTCPPEGGISDPIAWHESGLEPSQSPVFSSGLEIRHMKGHRLILIVFVQDNVRGGQNDGS